MYFSSMPRSCHRHFSRTADPISMVQSLNRAKFRYLKKKLTWWVSRHPIALLALAGVRDLPPVCGILPPVCGILPLVCGILPPVCGIFQPMCGILPLVCAVLPLVCAIIWLVHAQIFERRPLFCPRSQGHLTSSARLCLLCRVCVGPSRRRAVIVLIVTVVGGKRAAASCHFHHRSPRLRRRRQRSRPTRRARRAAAGARRRRRPRRRPRRRRPRCHSQRGRSNRRYIRLSTSAQWMDGLHVSVQSAPMTWRSSSEVGR